MKTIIETQQINSNTPSGDFEELLGALPFGYQDSYTLKLNATNQDFIQYLKENAWSLFKYKVVDEQGDSPGWKDIENPPKGIRMQQRDRKVWNSVKHKLEKIFTKLTENYSIYVSTWILLPEDVKVRLPQDFPGRILPRTSNKLPVVVEWRTDFDMIQSPFWEYGTWGFLFKKTVAEENLIQYLKLKEYSPNLVTEFMNQVEGIFWVKNELDGIWIITKQESTKRISEIF